MYFVLHMEVIDKKNIPVATGVIDGMKQISIEKRFNKQKLWFWRLIAVVCIIPGWIIMFAPFLPRILTELFPKFNISQNEILLDKLNLSNVTVLCPEGYTFSRMEQRCSTVCGSRLPWEWNFRSHSHPIPIGILWESPWESP